MKKLIFVIVAIIYCAGLTNCELFRYYSFKDITGYKTSEIPLATYNNSKYQSAEFHFNLDYLKYLDVDYQIIKENFYSDIFNGDSDYSLEISIYDNTSKISPINQFFIIDNYIYVISNEINYKSIEETLLLDKINADNQRYYDAEHCLVLLEYHEATCQEEGYQVIGCSACDELSTTEILPIVDCQYIDGICRWCGNADINSLYKFIDLYEFGNLINLDNIVQIKIDIGPGSIAPPWLHKCYISSDKTYFAEVLDFIDKVKFIECNDPCDGVGTYDVTISTTEEDYCLSFTSRNEYYIKDKIYNALLDFPMSFIIPEQAQVCYYYQTISELEFISYGEKITLEKNYLDGIYFEQIDCQLAYLDLTKDATLVIEGTVELIIESSKTFFIENNYYRVVSEKDFSDLLEGINETTSVITLVDENDNMFLQIKVSNNTVYIFDEFRQVLEKFGYNNPVIIYLDGTKCNDQEINEDLTLKVIEPIPEC